MTYPGKSFYRYLAIPTPVPGIAEGSRGGRASVIKLASLFFPGLTAAARGEMECFGPPLSLAFARAAAAARKRVIIAMGHENRAAVEKNFRYRGSPMLQNTLVHTRVSLVFLVGNISFFSAIERAAIKIRNLLHSHFSETEKKNLPRTPRPRPFPRERPPNKKQLSPEALAFLASFSKINRYSVEQYDSTYRQGLDLLL